MVARFDVHARVLLGRRIAVPDAENPRLRTRKLAYVAVVNVYVIADAQRSDGDEPTTPRTVIGAGESESVPVAADSVVHKHGGRRRRLFPSRVAAPFSPSLPIRAHLSLSLAHPRPLFPIPTGSL